MGSLNSYLSLSTTSDKMPRSYLKEEEITKKVKEFLSADKDNDCKITIKQMCKILGHDYKIVTANPAQNQVQEDPLNINKNESLLALIGKIKIDFPTFLEFHQKHEVSKLLKKIETEMSDGEANGQANLSEATKKKMFEMMDKDASGGISKAELAQWIKSTQAMDSEAEDVEEEVVTTEFNRIDSNQDGQLSYDEMDCAMHAGQEKADDMGKC